MLKTFCIAAAVLFSGAAVAVAQVPPELQGQHGTPPPPPPVEEPPPVVEEPPPPVVEEPPPIVESPPAPEPEPAPSTGGDSGCQHHHALEHVRRAAIQARIELHKERMRAHKARLLEVAKAAKAALAAKAKASKQNHRRR